MSAQLTVLVKRRQTDVVKNARIVAVLLLSGVAILAIALLAMQSITGIQLSQLTSDFLGLDSIHLWLSSSPVN